MTAYVGRHRPPTPTPILTRILGERPTPAPEAAPDRAWVTTETVREDLLALLRRP